MIGRISKVRKRDGRLVDFDESKIADAIHKAGCAVGREDRFLADELAGVVTLFLEKRFSGSVPGIEEIQDMVERVLIETGHARMSKAYILYRERRARSREHVRVHGEAQSGPLVGNMSKARVSRWSKARIADALVREADLDERLAGKVARSVEERVFERGVARITTTAIRSLVEAELFARGYGDRVGRQALVGLPRYDVDSLLRGKRAGVWRPRGPRELKRALADAMLAQYALSEVYSAEVVDAHLDASLHIIDVGSPTEWLAAVAEVGPSTGLEEWVEAVAGGGARLGDLVTRDVMLTGVVDGPCAWAVGAGPGSAIGAARRLLGHSALRAFDGGRLRWSVSFSLMQKDEGAALLAEGLVREHWARFRAGTLAGLPSLVTHLDTGSLDDDEGRRAVLPALAAAAETGRILFVCDRETPALVSPWFRTEMPPATGAAALPVAGAVAVNVKRLAVAADGEDALLEGLDQAIVRAVKALRQKRSFLGSLQADPGAPLYRVAAGAHPVVAGQQGFDLVHLVGVTSAVQRHGGDAAAAARLAGRLRAYAAVRAAEEGRAVRLRVLVAPEHDGEAAARFLDAEDPPDRDPYALPAALADLAAEASFEGAHGMLTLRFPREAAPAPETLYDALCLIARDPRVGAVRLQPWPDRMKRVGRTEAQMASEPAPTEE